MIDLRRALLPLLALLALPARAEVSVVAHSDRLGLEVRARDGWCATAPAMELALRDAGTLADERLAPALRRLGAIAAQECPQAASITLEATVGGRPLSWRASLHAARGWMPEPSGVTLPAGPGPLAVLGRHLELRDGAVLLDGAPVLGGAAAGPARLEDARGFGALAFVVVATPAAEAGCRGPRARLLLLSPRGHALPAGELGTCADAPLAVTLDAGGWRATRPGPRPGQETRFRLDTATGTVARSVAAVEAPDLRPLLAGRPATAVLEVPAAAAALRALLGEADEAALRALLGEGPGASFRNQGEWVVGTACGRGDCPRRMATMAFGPGGQAVIRLVRSGQVEFLGGPDAALRLALGGG